MRRILSTAIATHVGERVTVAGWVHRRRLLKSVAFLILRDEAGLAQVVARQPAERNLVESLTEETAVEVTAMVTANPAAPSGVELVGAAIRLLSPPAAPLPFDLFRPALTATLPTRLDHAALSLRHPARRNALRAAAVATAAFRSTLDELGFTEVQTPKIVASATESGANVFALDYFGRPAFLAQSPQFYKQMLVGVLAKVYEVGPVFRAEPHDTGRHLAQYTSLDVELGFIADHRDVMAVLRDVVAAMTGAVAAAGVLPSTPPVIVPAEIPTVHFVEALERVGAALGEDLSGEPDLAPAHERWLGQWARAEYGSDLLFVTGYPAVKRPFYTHPDPERPGYTNGFDLLLRGMELVTGGQRLHRYDDYVAALTARGEPLTPYESYLDAFRYGMPPHGGFAIGLERFVALLAGVANVREVAAFPRDRHRLTP